MQIYQDDKISYALITSLLDEINESANNTMDMHYITAVQRDWKYKFGDMSSITFSVLIHSYGHTFGRILHVWL